MTEEEWLALNAGLMLLHLEERGSISPRKLRLLAVTYARYLETQPEYADAKPVIHLGEEVAEGRATRERLLDPAVIGWGLKGHWGISHLVLAADNEIGRAIRRIMSFGMGGLNPTATDAERAFKRQCDVVRPSILCIFGNPFRPAALDPQWRTSTVLALARGIYDQRAFETLPILADALQDAGCENADILDHCRNPGPHARGCWVVDLVLGKS